MVPRLKGKRLAGSKRVLKRAGCRIGKVKKKIGAAASKGKVVRQSAKPGRVLPPAAKVGVTLGR